MYSIMNSIFSFFIFRSGLSDIWFNCNRISEGLLYIASVKRNITERAAVDGIRIRMGTKVLGANPSQIPADLPRDRTVAAAVCAR
jgi:hypothetical protein